MFQKIFKIISNIILLFVLGIGILVVISFAKVPGGFKLFTVMSGSMEPVLHTGSIIFDKPRADYNVGEVVTRMTQDPNVTITHRIVSKQEVDGQTVFQTKGDANNAPDGEMFARSDIIGKEFLTIPFLGYLVNFAKTKQGIMLLVIIPAVIIIYDELAKIAQEIKKLRQKKIEEKGTLVFEKEKPEKPSNKRPYV